MRRTASKSTNLPDQVQDTPGEHVEVAYIDRGLTGQATEETAAAHGIRLKRGCVLLLRRCLRMPHDRQPALNYSITVHSPLEGSPSSILYIRGRSALILRRCPAVVRCSISGALRSTHPRRQPRIG